MNIALSQIQCPAGSDDACFKKAVYDALLKEIRGKDEYREMERDCLGQPGIPAFLDDDHLRICRKTLDARNKKDLRHVYNVTLYYKEKCPEPTAKSLLAPAAAQNRPGSLPSSPSAAAFPYLLPSSSHSPSSEAKRPVIAGFGPAGIFAALFLARRGLCPLVIERGRAMDTRVRDVGRFWSSGILEERSNAQFGEGGAGTFSDGKLTTGIRDELIESVLGTFVDAGAPSDILYSAYPHIGTDILRAVIVRIRERLIKMGAEVRFETRLTGIYAEHGLLQGIRTEHSGEECLIPAENLILATGHSARDTITMLHRAGVWMEAKPFAAGLRIEHLQDSINRAQLGIQAPSVMRAIGPASYKLVCHLPSGRSVYTFCMCPGGRVIAGSSAIGQVVTNGMSDHSRSEANANSALLVNITPEDFRCLPGEPGVFSCGERIDPLSGLCFQEAWENAAFRAGGGDYRAPAQYLEDFLYRDNPGPASHIHDRPVVPTYQPGVTFTDLRQCLPDFIHSSIREALPEFGRKIRGFDSPGAVVTGIESRSSSPVRIVRDAGRMANIGGIYPCGEGAGYAGGIMSSAVDGIRCAMACEERIAVKA